MKYSVAHIYRKVLKVSYSCAVWIRQLYTRAQNGDGFEMPSKDDSFKEKLHL